jgi:hypothetical protein
VIIGGNMAEEYSITKLVPMETEHPGSILGYMQGSVEINGDLLAPLDEPWEADI